MDDKSSDSNSKECRNRLRSSCEEEANHAVDKGFCGIRKMWLAAFTSLLLCFTKGLSKGYSAPATYDMRHRTGSVIKPTEKEVMWIGSIMALGIVLGSLISGKHGFRHDNLL